MGINHLLVTVFIQVSMLSVDSYSLIMLQHSMCVYTSFLVTQRLPNGWGGHMIGCSSVKNCIPNVGGYSSVCLISNVCG